MERSCGASPQDVPAEPPPRAPGGEGASGTPGGGGAAATARAALSLACWIVLILAARCATAPDVFVGGSVYFLDADCYARMTRVREVMAHPGRIVRHHTFENFPHGTTPHATAPMDYLIAALAAALGDPDLAGAWISPVLAVAVGAFLWWWARVARLRYGGMLMLLYAVSPILAHGAALGRPDHQSLLIGCLAVALAAEWMLASGRRRGWEITAGLAWGTALWVSLYEPLVLLALVLAAHALWRREALALGRRWIALGLVLLAALLVEGPRIFQVDFAGIGKFAGQQIGELARVSPFSPTLYHWLGLGLAAAPFTIAWRMWREKARPFAPVFVVASLALLTMWQARWGYFFALAFAMSAPWLFATAGRRWIAWALFILCLWPVAREWEARLYPEGEARAQRLQQRYEAVALRDVAVRMRAPDTLPILAPWWLSPPLAYWSGQPAVAGSSHQSLPGILDTARFYMETDPAAARAILKSRGVRRVVLCDPSRIMETSAPLLLTAPSENAMAARLHRAPSSAPNFLQEEYSNPVIKVFSVW